MRKPAGLDLGDLEADFPTKPRPQVSTVGTSDSSEKAIAAAAAAEEGFTSRTGTGPKIDGRTLRRTGRTSQLNISVKPETKDAFWRMAEMHGHPNGEEFLLFLLSRLELESGR